MLNNMIISAAIIYVLFVVKPFSVTNNSVGSRTAAAGYVGAAIVAQVTCESTLFFVTERLIQLRKRFFDAMFLKAIDNIQH